jgi:hypothetical protein
MALHQNCPRTKTGAFAREPEHGEPIPHGLPKQLMRTYLHTDSEAMRRALDVE